MKRTSFFLDEKLLRQLKQMAYRRGVSLATVVREAMVSYLAAPAAGGTVPSIAGAFRSGRRDTSAHVDNHLWNDPHK